MATGAKLVILGKQGAGKGTQCVRLARHYVVAHISTGDMFRAARRSGSEAGKKLNMIDEGELVPDELVIATMEERLDQDDTRHRGFVLDGFPRTVGQAEALSKMLAPDDVDVVVDLRVPTEIALTRLAGRRVCEDCGANYGPGTLPRVSGSCDYCSGEVVQRADDTDASIRRRLALYEERTKPIINWYSERDLLVQVDGLGSLDEVTIRLIMAVDIRRGELDATGAMFDAVAEYEKLAAAENAIRREEYS